MTPLKTAPAFLGIFFLFSLPAFIMYQPAKKHQAGTKMMKAYRGIASVSMPATQTCETVQRVRWKCVGEQGEKKCQRDGFEHVRHCKPL